MEDIREIIQQARTKENWSANKRYNYGPIDYLSQKVMSCSNEIGVGKTLSLFYKHVKDVTDAKTFFAYVFKDFDIYVNHSDVVYPVKNAFPDIEIRTIHEWIDEFRQPHHVIRWGR